MFNQLKDEVNFSFSRSSGAGGQNVNKTNTKALMTWDYNHSSLMSSTEKIRFSQIAASYLTSSGVAQISKDEFRTQKQNKEACLKQLIKMVVASQKIPKKRVPTSPTRSSQRKRITSKKLKGLIKKNRGKVQY